MEETLARQGRGKLPEIMNVIKGLKLRENEEDKWVWLKAKNGSFSVQSAYDLLTYQWDCPFGRQRSYGDVVFVIMWSIWEAMNDLVFNNEAFSLERIVHGIQIRCFIWISSITIWSFPV
ncbi:hypothetical protein Ancab_007372 [Ancistrocladus abbreviatus]